MHIDRDPFHACGSADLSSRRPFLKSMGMLGLTWLTPLADLLAVDAEQAPKGKPARSVILLWLGRRPRPPRNLHPPPHPQNQPAGSPAQTHTTGEHTPRLHVRPH